MAALIRLFRNIPMLPRRLAFAALAIGFVLAVHAPARAAVYGAEMFTLANGMQVVVIQNHRAPIVSHMIWYRSGAADDMPGKSGIAHFLEHLMFKGTPRFPAGEITKTVALNGG